LTKKIDLEEETLCAFIIHPGFVSTDMGNRGAAHFGMEGGPPTSVDESCDGMVTLIGEATKGSHGGKLFQFTGEQMPW
jgi:norsolorinic acid ketoreductase